VGAEQGRPRLLGLAVPGRSASFQTRLRSGTLTLSDLRSASKTGDVVAVVNGLSRGHGHWFARLRPPVEHVASPSKKLDTVER